MRVAYLLGLQIYAGSFETGQQGEMVCCFSQGTFSRSGTSCELVPCQISLAVGAIKSCFAVFRVSP
jgi:hypothetical protein